MGEFYMFGDQYFCTVNQGEKLVVSETLKKVTWSLEAFNSQNKALKMPSHQTLFFGKNYKLTI